MIRRLFRREDTLSGVPIERAAPSTPVIQYVNMILYRMFQDGTTSRMLRQSGPLASVAELGTELTAPPLDAVVNRLKIMAGLNPVMYPKRVEGTIQLTIGGTECRVNCRFDDSADDRCSIRLEKKADAQIKD